MNVHSFSVLRLRFLPLALLAAALLFIDVPAWAEEKEPAKSGQETEQPHSDELRLPEMNVLASPVIEGNVVDRYGATTTVVSKDQIEDLNALDLPSALRRSPGVTISRFNHVGSFGGGEGGAIFIRGKGSSRPGSEIKTYVDGVPMYMGPWNHPLMDLMPVDAAESVEVIKGPQPQRFGDTLSAVNITPKRMLGEESTTTLKFAGGSFGTFSQSAEHGGRDGGFDYYLGESFIRSDGHRKDSGAVKAGYYANLGYQLDDAWQARVYALGVSNRVEDPGPDLTPSVKEGRYGTNAQLVSLSFAHDYELLDGEAKFFVNTGEGNWKDQSGATDDNYNDFTFWGVRLKETLHPWQGGDLSVGLDQDWWNSRIRNVLYSGAPDQTIILPEFSLTMPYAAFSQYLGDEDGWHVMPSMGVRFYEHNRFDSETAPNFGLVFGYADTEAHVSVSKGIVYPGHDVISIFPDAQWQNLKPEETDHFEAGLSHSFGEFAAIDVTYFYDEGKNRYVFRFPGPTWSNVEKYNIHGWETSLTVTPLDTLSLFAGLTIQEATPGDMPYVPETTISGGLAWRFLEDFKLNLDCQYLDKMFVLRQARAAGALNTQEVDSHFVTNARIGWNFQSEMLASDGEVYLALENILDEEYAYQPDYPMPGINGMLGLKLSF